MARLEWDKETEKLYETGVSDAILFVRGDDGYEKGVAWNGVTAFNISPSGGEATKLYADNDVYLTMYSAEEIGATIEAYMSPEEFDICDGSAELATGVTVKQQTRKTFALIVKTLIGNDTDNTDYGYKYHILYGCKASPSAKNYSTTNESPEAMTLSWEITTVPVKIAGKKNSALIEIDSTKVNAAKLTAFENMILGTDPIEADSENGIEGSEGTDSTLPTPAQIAAMFAVG